MSIRLEKVNCLICDGAESRVFYDSVPDRFKLEDSYTEVQCSGCGFVYLSPRPVAEDMSKFYDLEAYQPHHLSETSWFDRLYALVRKKNSVNKRKLIQTYLNGGKILDIGCGTADFLIEMKEQNWAVSGMESAPEARQIAIGKGLAVADELWKVEGRFDVITLWHVLEHVHRINELFDNIKRLLAPGGYLILAVPNRESLDARHYKAYWVALDAPRHLYHFRPQDVAALFAQNGLEIIKTSSLLYFDPWYNALLSAKLISAKKNRSLLAYLPGALIIGKVSFIYGLLNSAKCASPVFIARSQ